MQSGPDIVRSDHQRRLLDHWASLRGPTLPIWRQFDPTNLPAPADNLVVMEVVGDAFDPRFRIAIHGAQLAAAFGPVSRVGQFIDDILPPSYRDPCLSTYRHVVSSKQPVYTVSDMRDPAGRIVHNERLLLPFSMGGTEVERILASVEPMSPEGPFELRELMISPVRAPVIALCVTIQY